MAYGPIRLAYNLNQLQMQERVPEAGSSTFKQGVPVKLTSGYLAEVDSNWAGADVIYGVNSEPAHNLTTSGTAEPAYSEGTPPNQANAKIIPHGAWSRDGYCGVYQANAGNIFAISLKSGQTFSQALVTPATYYGLTKDGTTGYWYCDSTDTSGNNAVLEIVGGVPGDTTQVYVRFKASQRAFD